MLRDNYITSRYIGTLAVKVCKLFILTFMLTMLSGCGIIHGYRANFTQGNDFTYKQAQQIKIGMTKSQVLAILGSPILVNTFRDNTWDYIYEIHHGPQVLHHRYLIVHFRNGRVASIEKHIGEPPPSPPQKPHHWW